MAGTDAPERVRRRESTGTRGISRHYRDLADFRYAMRLFLHFAEEEALAAGITPQQHQLLLVVRGHPAYPMVTISDIAERLQVRHHTASRLVDRAVQRHLLERHADSVDRRRVVVTLTAEGEQVLERITRATWQELQSLEGDLFRESLRRALHTHDPTESPPHLRPD